LGELFRRYLLKVSILLVGLSRSQIVVFFHEFGIILGFSSEHVGQSPAFSIEPVVSSSFALISATRRSTSVVSSLVMPSAMEESSEEAFLFSFLLNDFLDLEQIVLVVDFGFTFSAQTEERAVWAFVPDACNGTGSAGLALVSLMDNGFELLRLFRLLGKLLTNAGNQSFDALVN
jgi:hypothetical protein